MKKWQIAISILLVFAIGTAAGAYGSKVVFKKKVSRALHTEGTPGIKVIQQMMGKLDLSESQRASINAIVDENNKKWETIREEYEPKIKELYETVIEETKKELTDEQRKEIEQMSAKVQRRLPPRDTSRPRSSSPEGGSGPPAMNQPFGQKPDSDRVAGILEQLKVEPEKSAEVKSIIESNLERQQALRDEFEKSQASAEEKFQKEMADILAATDKKLAGLLTPEQIETYRRMINPEEPRPDEPRLENFGDDFGFDAPGDTMQPKDFDQGDHPIHPEGQPGMTQDYSRPAAGSPQGSRSI